MANNSLSYSEKMEELLRELQTDNSKEGSKSENIPLIRSTLSPELAAIYGDVGGFGTGPEAQAQMLSKYSDKSQMDDVARGRDKGGGMKASRQDDGTITLTAEDREWLIRVAATEAHTGLLGRGPEKDRAYYEQARGVVDTILNRYASGKYGSSIREIINAPLQFSAISGPPGVRKYDKDVANVPYNLPSKELRDDLNNWLDARILGAPSSVDGGLNFANPFASDKKNLSWIEALDGPKYGRGEMIHYHGTEGGGPGFTAVVKGEVDPKWAYLQKAGMFQEYMDYVQKGTVTTKPQAPIPATKSPSLAARQAGYADAKRSLLSTISGVPIAPLAAPAPLQFPLASPYPSVLREIVTPPLPRPRPDTPGPSEGNKVGELVEGVGNLYDTVVETQKFLTRLLNPQIPNTPGTSPTVAPRPTYFSPKPTQEQMKRIRDVSGVVTPANPMKGPDALPIGAPVRKEVLKPNPAYEEWKKTTAPGVIKGDKDQAMIKAIRDVSGVSTQKAPAPPPRYIRTFVTVPSPTIPQPVTSVPSTPGSGGGYNPPSVMPSLYAGTNGYMYLKGDSGYINVGLQPQYSGMSSAQVYSQLSASAHDPNAGYTPSSSGVSGDYFSTIRSGGTYG